MALASLAWLECRRKLAPSNTIISASIHPPICSTQESPHGLVVKAHSGGPSTVNDCSTHHQPLGPYPHHHHPSSPCRRQSHPRERGQVWAMCMQPITSVPLLLNLLFERMPPWLLLPTLHLQSSRAHPYQAILPSLPQADLEIRTRHQIPSHPSLFPSPPSLSFSAFLPPSPPLSLSQPDNMAAKALHATRPTHVYSPALPRHPLVSSSL